LIDIEFDLDALPCDTLVVNKRVDSVRHAELRALRLAKEQEMSTQAGSDCEYTEMRAITIQGIVSERERKSALEKQSSKYRVYTRAETSTVGVQMRARQEARGWNNSVHLRMQALMSKINQETSVPDSKHSRFEQAYRTLVRDDLLKAQKKNRPAFEVDLGLLYGDL
jgi:hypothetical protein